MGVQFQLLVVGVSLIAITITIYRAKQGIIPKIRTIVCLEVMDELIGRAAEMGKSVHFVTGSAPMTGAEAPVVASGLAMLGYVAELCGKYRVPLRYTMIYSITLPVAQDLIKTGYTKGGHPELYNDDMIYYAGESQPALMSEIMRYIYEEKPAVSLLFGPCKYEALNTLGAAAIAGCIQAAGTSRLYYNAFLAACCDYCMIGDEIYAAVAIIKDTPEEKAIIQGQDIIKGLVMLLILCSIILNTSGAGDLLMKIITA